MGACVYTDIRVFEIELPEEQAPRANDLHNTPMPLIVVFEQTYFEDDYPHTPGWAIGYTGTPEDWPQHVDFMEAVFDDGVSRLRDSRGFQCGKEIREKLGSLFSHRRPLTVQDCHEMEHRAYDWPIEYGFKGVPFKEYSKKSDDRTGHLIKTERDLQELAIECLKVKDFIKADLGCDVFWCGQPHSLSGHFYDLVAKRSIDQPDVTAEDEEMAPSL